MLRDHRAEPHPTSPRPHHGPSRCAAAVRGCALLLALALALPLAACLPRPDGSSPQAPGGLQPTPIDLEAIPYQTRLAQDITALEGACTDVTRALEELDADPSRLDDSLWTIELEAAATEAWAATLVILARENVPTELAEAHQQLQAPANEVNLAAESIVYPAEGVEQRSVETLLALRPTFAATCEALVETARPMLENVSASPEDRP